MDPKSAQPNPSEPVASSATPAPVEPAQSTSATDTPATVASTSPASTATPQTTNPLTPEATNAPANTSSTTTPQAVTPAATQPADKPKAKPMKKILLVLLVILVLIGLGVGSYYILSQKRATPHVAKVVPTPTAQPTPTPDPTANWQTYVGDGFSFMYPKNWVMKKNTFAPYDTYFYDPTTASASGNGGGTTYKDNLDVTTVVSTQTIDAYITSMKSKQSLALAKDFQTKQISFNDKQVSVYYQGGEGTAGWYVPFSNGNKIVIFGPLATDPSQDSIALQILKTFKFIDPVSSVVQSYYLSYRACLDKHFQAANAGTSSNQTPQQDCPYNLDGQLTTALTSQLNKVTGADPVLCAQNVPLNITFDAPVVNSARASVVVHTLWGSSSPESITVGLDQVANTWKISSITCPK